METTHRWLAPRRVEIVFRRKPPVVPYTDLIDLLLESDEPTRKQLLVEALQSGLIGQSEADEVMAMASRLERAAAPRSEETARKAAEVAAAQTPARAA
jgi:hypothetical protein